VAGYWLTLSFLVVETGFYLYNEAGAIAHGFAPFFHLLNPDPTLFVVFAIGYLNMVAGVVFVALLLAWRRSLAPSAEPHPPLPRPTRRGKDAVARG
jgi:cation transporter-like permease